MKEYDNAGGNLPAVRNFLIPDILLNIRRCCHHIQRSCIFPYPVQLENALLYYPSQYFLVPIVTVIYKTVYRSNFEEANLNICQFTILVH